MYLKHKKNMSVKCKLKDLGQMKVKLGFILLFFLFIMFGKCVIPNYIVLAENEIGVSTSKEIIEKEQIVEVTVDTGNIDISSLTLQIYFDTTRLEYVNQTENSNFSQNRVIYTWTDENLKEKSGGKTEKFRFKAIQDGSANIVVTGEFYDKNGNQIALQDGATQVMIGNQDDIQSVTNDNGDDEESQEQMSSDNTNLSTLRLNHEGISPDFQKGIKEYYFIADTSMNSLEVTAIPENKNATVTVTGNTNFKQGLNTIKIEVQSADKTKKSTYTIHVTKTSNPNLANANLENLAVREAMLYPAFDANITHYDIEVANDIDNVYVLAVPERIGATVTISGNDKLQVGDNVITINVSAEDGITHKKYVITAHRRNEQEEVESKEERENQIDQLKVIIENQTEEDENNEENNRLENKSEIKTVDMITWYLLAVIMIGFTIAFVMSKRKK